MQRSRRLYGLEVGRLNQVVVRRDEVDPRDLGSDANLLGFLCMADQIPSEGMTAICILNTAARTFTGRIVPKLPAMWWS